MTNLPTAMSDLPINPLTSSHQKITIQDAQPNHLPNPLSQPAHAPDTFCFVDGQNLTQLTASIRELERGLLTPPHGQQQSFVNQVLDDEFHEYQRTGQRVDKAMAIQWIISSAGKYHWRFSDFSLTALSNSQVLAHYFAYQHDPQTKRCKRSRHSSIWRYHQARWQLLYHHANSLPIVTHLS
ncbi:MAG TPA: hypothetical protein ENK78_04135 [Thiothrix sp.]|nr:hypothetical protein [Thiothrix sp.]